LAKYICGLLALEQHIEIEKNKIKNIANLLVPHVSIGVVTFVTL
jgi:hypothetical protein